MRHLIPLFLITSVLLLIGNGATAQILGGDILWDYQGNLEENGILAADGPYTMEFRIYDVELGGTALWTESQIVQVADGRFNVHLGSIIDFPDWYITGIPRWIEIDVNGETLMPRTRLTSVPSAYAAGRVSGDIRTTPGNLYVYYPPSSDSVSGIIQSADAAGAHFTASTYGAGSVVLDADSGRAIVSVGLPDLEPLQSHLEATTSGAALIIIYDERDLVGFRGTQLASTQSIYHRIPAGDSTSGITATADANGARLMVSDYDLGGADGITLSTGSTGSLISVSGVGSGGTAGLALRNDRIRLGELSTAVPNSVALGNRAKANHAGSFVLADMSAMDLVTTTPDQFLVRASGGTTIYSNNIQTTGVSLPANGGQWEMVSDSALKSNIRPIDGGQLLDRLADVPISRWNYEGQSDEVEHIGPMAQDFYAAFGLGGDETKISSLDPAGVALAAIKELTKRTERIAELEADLAKQQQQINELRALVKAMAAQR